MRKPNSKRSGSATPSAVEDTGGLDALAETVDHLATEAALKALDATSRIAAADTPTAGSRVARVADDVSARTRRLEMEVGRALLGRRRS